jgi:acetoin utilization protein AcuB
MAYPDDKLEMTNAMQAQQLDSIMTKDPVCVDMDLTLGHAMELCSEKRIRHLPVLDESKHLIGMVTDRDLRYHISPRIGTLSENNSDRATLGRHVHQIMVRQVVSATAETAMSEAAQRMLENGVGCLPVVDGERHVIGIITTADFLRYIAKNQ